MILCCFILREIVQKYTMILIDMDEMHLVLYIMIHNTFYGGILKHVLTYDLTQNMSLMFPFEACFFSPMRLSTR